MREIVMENRGPLCRLFEERVKRIWAYELVSSGKSPEWPWENLVAMALTFILAYIKAATMFTFIYLFVLLVHFSVFPTGCPVPVAGMTSRLPAFGGSS